MCNLKNVRHRREKQRIMSRPILRNTGEGELDISTVPTLYKHAVTSAQKRDENKWKQEKYRKGDLDNNINTQSSERNTTRSNINLNNTDRNLPKYQSETDHDSEFSKTRSKTGSVQTRRQSLLQKQTIHRYRDVTKRFPDTNTTQSTYLVGDSDFKLGNNFKTSRHVFTLVMDSTRNDVISEDTEGMVTMESGVVTTKSVKDTSQQTTTDREVTNNKQDLVVPSTVDPKPDQTNNAKPAVPGITVVPRRRMDRKSKSYSVAFGSTVGFNPTVTKLSKRQQRHHARAPPTVIVKSRRTYPKSERNLKLMNKKSKEIVKDIATIHGEISTHDSVNQPQLERNTLDTPRDQTIARYVSSLPFLVDRSTSMSDVTNTSVCITNGKPITSPLASHSVDKSRGLNNTAAKLRSSVPMRHKRSADKDVLAPTLNVFKALDPNRKKDVELFKSRLTDHKENELNASNNLSQRKFPLATQSAKVKVLKELNKNISLLDTDSVAEYRLSRQNTLSSSSLKLETGNVSSDVRTSPRANLLDLTSDVHRNNQPYITHDNTSVFMRSDSQNRPNDVTTYGKTSKVAAVVMPTVRIERTPDRLPRMSQGRSSSMNNSQNNINQTSSAIDNLPIIVKVKREGDIYALSESTHVMNLNSSRNLHNHANTASTSLPGSVSTLNSMDKQDILNRIINDSFVLFDGYNFRRGKTVTPVSDIQYGYSDEEADGQPEPRPFTDSYRGHPFTLGGAGRYEQRKNGTSGSVKTIPAIAPGNRKENGVRANLVTFYINGDRNYKGLTIAVSGKKWLNIDKLKEHLTTKIGTHWPVKCIFTIPDRQLIDDLDKFENNRSYIVCKDKNAQVNGIHYGYSNEKHWVTKRPSAGKIRKHDLGMLKHNPPANSPSKNRRVITIIQQIDPDRIRKEKVILNPETTMSFDQILSDMGDMINMHATALYLYKKPETRVTSYAQLFREFKTVDEFKIDGDVPEGTGQKRTAPSSNSSNGSVNSRGSRQKKMQKSLDYDLQEDEDFGVDYSVDNDDGRGWEDPIEQVSFDDTLDNDEDNAKRVKVRIRGKYKEYFVPERPAPGDRSRPNEKLILEWLYGYRSNDNSTSMMVYHKTGELVCYMDAAVVFYNRTFDQQRFYLAHTEEITCMALHPEGRWIATGQKAGSGAEDVAHIRIWDGRTLSTQVILGVDKGVGMSLGTFTSGISSVNFSVFRDGVLLCAVDSSDKHVLTVWEWNRKRLLAKTTTTSRHVSHACFYPFDDTILITYGDQHLYFWKLFWDPVRDTDGRLLRDKESGAFTTEDSREITSIAFPHNGDVVTGDTTGSVIVWAVDRTTHVFRFQTVLPDRHHRSVNSLCMLPEGTLVSGGGKEIKAWSTLNNHYRKTRERVLADGVGDVASIVLKDKSVTEGGKPVFYIGTTNSCILEGSFEDKLKKHIEAHFDTVSSVVSHPRENSFFSASMDGTVKKWSADKHRLLYTKNVEKPCSCIDIDKKGRYLTVGTADGFVIVIGSSLKDEIAIIKVGSSAEFIECVKISPERETLAVGCHGGCVYIYNDVNDGAKIAIRNNTIFKANPVPVINVDWTTNSHYIQSMSSDHDLFHWDVTDMIASKAVTFRDAEWHTQNVTVGYPVCGMWTNLKDDDEVKVVDRSPNSAVIAAGDNKGSIRLYKYPCSGIKPDFKVTKMYSNEVTALSFLARTDRLISCGGQKSVLAQWKVEKYVTSNEH